MTFRFPVVVLSFTALLGGLIYMLYLLGLVTSANEVYARICALSLFVASFLILGWQKAKYHRFSWDDIFKNNTLVIVVFTMLLTVMLIRPRTGFYFTGIFIGVAFLHFLCNRKFYPPPKFFYFVILYALLLFFGTIGTEKGFRFPNKILSFFLLPLAFCFFRLPQRTLLQIGAVFFRMGIVFLSLCLLYWWFNFLYLDADLTGWIGGKTAYSAQMTGWDEQAKTIDRALRGTVGWENISYFSAYFFVTSWSYFYHPSFVSFVLFFGLITGFYLYHKKNILPTITRFELILYIAFCFIVMLLMQSRIGIIGLLFIIAVTGLYYLKLKTNYFKIGLAVCLLLGSASFFVLNDKISGFTNDETRSAFRSVAISYIQQNFLWGSGYNQQHLALEKEAKKIKDSLPKTVYPNNSQGRITYVHNQFLGDMVQYGIWGLLALLLMLGTIMYYAVKNRSYLLQMMVCFLILFMMIEEPLYVLVGITPTLVFLIFFAAIGESTKKPKNKTQAKL